LELIVIYVGFGICQGIFYHVYISRSVIEQCVLSLEPNWSRLKDIIIFR